MASVFLSYARDDAGKARPLALALEKAGHSVWWDLHVRGGAQFSKVIEEALKAADVVVVLWSKDAIESPWVRDEAAAGRDTGRLVPVTIDGTEPPLGFRQYQTIDLSRWKGRGRPAELHALLGDVEAFGAKQGSRVQPAAQPAALRRSLLPEERRYLVLGISALLVVVVLSGLYWLYARRSPTVPTVVVAAADTSPLSEEMARNLLAKLGSLQANSPAPVQLPAAIGAGNSDIRLTVDGAQQGSQIRANVSLVSRRDKAMLWSKDLERPAASRSTLEEALAFAASLALRCAAEEASSEGQRLRADLRHLYINACTSLDEDDGSGSLIPPLRKITDAAPHFAPAWALLLRAEAAQLASASTDDQAAQELRADIRSDIPSAAKADSGLPEITVANVAIRPPGDFLGSIGLLDKENAEHPDDAQLLAERSAWMMKVGRTSDAVHDAARAAELKPFSPVLRANYVTTLAYSGGIEKAWGELAKIKQTWPSAPPVLSADYAINLRFGDYEKTVRSSGQSLEGGLLYYFKIRRDPSDANINAWLNLARTHELTSGQRFFVLQALGPLHRVDELFELMKRWPVKQDLQAASYVLFRPSTAQVRRDPRFMQLARQIGLVDYWQKSGKWPDFCVEPDMPYDCKKEAARLAA